MGYVIGQIPSNLILIRVSLAFNRTMRRGLLSSSAATPRAHLADSFRPLVHCLPRDRLDPRHIRLRCSHQARPHLRPPLCCRSIRVWAFPSGHVYRFELLQAARAGEAERYHPGLYQCRPSFQWVHDVSGISDPSHQASAHDRGNVTCGRLGIVGVLIGRAAVHAGLHGKLGLAGVRTCLRILDPPMIACDLRRIMDYMYETFHTQ